MKKIVKFITGTLTAVFLLGNTVFAKPAANDPSQDGNVNVNIEKLDNDIQNALVKLDSNNKEITKTSNDIKSLEQQIKNNDNDITQHKDILKKRVRAAYINGSDGYIEMILDSKDFSDFLSRMEAIKTIVAFDNKTIASLNDKKGKMETEKKNLSEKSTKLLSLKSDTEKKIAKLNSDKDAAKKLAAQSQQTQGLYASAAVSKASLSRGASVSLGSNAVVNYAYSFIGTPYVWGGTSPSGFDCSGFTQYVYAHFGVGLGRTTYEQINDGSTVSRDQLQPGDLVLFGTSSNPHHVGIYVGNGMYIHAPQTGDVVKVSPLTRGDYLTAKRVK
ncbi:NlpC/P60 family protein [Clostridium sp. JS66]|uniref:C40 family peptidase n=1 Tax=Clostridium sp. JS66 TaxID=3064705 RepID=UPI00298D8AB1|nr:NlpC/P60 family protein [Clostridium sp. JS66]WPC44563.1 NlpC/P60 family protein [Clostridium sp. JS66]